MSESPVSAYFQLGDNPDAYVPNENPAQLVDLDELYQETDQDGKTLMVQGTESLSLGVLSREIALRFKLPNAREFDPFPSKRNAVIGQEGFFTTMYEGFKSFIEGIIKYIRMAFDWVANTIKGIFGFRKSERIEKAIDSSLDGLKEEIKNTLSSLGFPAAEYNLETFIGKMPSAVDRNGQLVIMRTKFETDRSAIEGLKQSLPLFQQCIAKLTQCSNRALKVNATYSKVIKDMYDRTRVRNLLQQAIPGEVSPEVNRLIAASDEVLVALDTKAVVEEVAKLLSTLYKVEFKNDALTDGFGKVRKSLEEEVTTHSVNLAKIDVKALMAEIQTLNLGYVYLSKNSIDMSGINLKALGQAIDKTDADRVLALSNYYNAKEPVERYQQVAVGIRNYANFCQMVSRQLLVVERQINGLIGWYARSHMWYLHGLLGDMDKLRELMLEARAEGLKPQADPLGNPKFKMEFIPEAEARTFMENFSATNRKVLDEDIGELKTRYNNLVKQLGVGKTL